MHVRDMSRRQMLVRAAASAASLSLAVSLTATEKAQAKVDPAPDAAKDTEQLNALLAAEYDAVATYTAGAGIIAADTATAAATRDVVTRVAAHFQSQHQEHALALKALIEANGGTAVADSGKPTLPASFPAKATVSDVMMLAADKEKHAAVAYAGVMQVISTQAAAKLIAAIGAVETQHFVVLYLLVEGLIAANDATAMNAELIVPAAFVVDVGLAGSKNLETFAALDALLKLDPP